MNKFDYDEFVHRPSINEFYNRTTPIRFTFDVATTVALIGQLQLSFRHPQNVGPSRQLIEKFIRELIVKLDPDRGDVYEFLMMGFDAQFDQ